MANPYQSVGDYLQFIRDKYNVQICVKDFGGFIHINKDLSEALDPFLAHTNPFCLYMKSEPERFHVCLSMIRKMHDKLLRTKSPSSASATRGWESMWCRCIPASCCWAR